MQQLIIFDIRKVVIKILQTVLVANCICAKNYESQLAIEKEKRRDKVIALIINSLFWGPPCI